jgi:hypothetical protein
MVAMNGGDSGPGDSGPGGAHGENLDDLRTNA